MGLMDFLRSIFGGRGTDQGQRPADRLAAQKRKTAERGGGLGIDELARRLGMSVQELREVPVSYRRFSIPKRSGGQRTILAPEAALKRAQRRILRRVLGRLKAHPTAMGFERGRSIVTNAAAHAGAAVVVRMDLVDFFPSTLAGRAMDLFYAVGWGQEASQRLFELTTSDGGLPQGAPTSPRLSNLLNCVMDARLAALARRMGACYTRYADDLTFSLARDDHATVQAVIRLTKRIVGEYGYRLHQKRKLRIARRHQSQRVTGLVVNERPALPRETRRRLRAVAHHIETGQEATLTGEQLEGWRALEHMIEAQSQPSA